MITEKLFEGADRESLSVALDIRIKVFVEEQGVPITAEHDDYDFVATHILLYNNNLPAATARLVYRDNMCLIGRVAVLPEYRGLKLGIFLINRLKDIAFKNGTKEIHLHAQTQVQGFYEKLGFQAYGQCYMEDGIEHISMFCEKQTLY